MAFYTGRYDRTRGNSFKPKAMRFSLDLGNKFFTERVVRYWNKLSRKVVDAPSLVVLKAVLDGALSNLIQCKESLPIAGGWNEMINKTIC